jgi:hypothetical protein
MILRQQTTPEGEAAAPVEDAGGTWEPLPAETFRESGAGVNTVLITIDAAPE